MPHPPFRLIAVVHDVERAVDTMRWAAGAGLSVGVMLRDQEHRPDAVRRLAEAVASRVDPIGPNVRLIANATAVAGIPFVHVTSGQIEASAGSLPVGAEPDVHAFGASVHDARQAVRAADLGAAYLIASPVFPTSSKPGHPGIGIDGLRAIVGAVAVPVFALGGVTCSGAGAVIDAGAWGVAAVSLFAPDARRDLECVAGLLRAKFPMA